VPTSDPPGRAARAADPFGRGLRPPPGIAPPDRPPDAPPPGTRLGPHYAECFACGDQPGGLHLSITVEDGVRTSARFLVGREHQGAPGLAHGGVLAAAFDEALGSLLWLLGRPAVTRRLDTEFLRPVPVGTTLCIAARCLGIDRRKIFSAAEGRLDGPDGPLAVRADALFIAVGLDHFRTHGWGFEAPSQVNP
jgi:acyl-coenzyme A thioesterase PaaI-like protein